MKEDFEGEVPHMCGYIDTKTISECHVSAIESILDIQRSLQ